MNLLRSIVEWVDFPREMARPIDDDSIRSAAVSSIPVLACTRASLVSEEKHEES